MNFRIHPQSYAHTHNVLNHEPIKSFDKLEIGTRKNCGEFSRVTKCKHSSIEQ